MSLSLRKRYTAHLAPGAVTLAELKGALRPRPHQRTVLPAPLDASWSWADAVAQMDSHLEKFNGSGGAIDIVVADTFLRYAVLPWSDELSGQQEVEALARFRLEELFGPEVAAWDLVIDRQEFGCGGLVCAIAPGLPALLEERCAARKLTLRSLVPDFMERYNRLRGRVTTTEFLYAGVSDGRCQIAYRNASGWQSMRAVPLRERSAAALNDIMERELLLQDCADDVEIHINLPEAWRAIGTSLTPRYRVEIYDAGNGTGRAA